MCPICASAVRKESSAINNYPFGGFGTQNREALSDCRIYLQFTSTFSSLQELSVIAYMMTFFGLTDDGGLRFAESEAKEVKLTPFQWMRSCHMSDNYFSRYKNMAGVSSLAEMSLRSVVKYRHALTADVLKDVPFDPLGEQVWKQIGEM
jgi:hypothetical protein